MVCTVEVRQSQKTKEDTKGTLLMVLTTVDENHKARKAPEPISATLDLFPTPSHCRNRITGKLRKLIWFLQSLVHIQSVTFDPLHNCNLFCMVPPKFENKVHDKDVRSNCCKVPAHEKALGF